MGAGRRIPFRIPRAELQAQALACTHLVRACRQAIDDLKLEGSGDSAVNSRAITILQDVQTEWSTALKALRKISRR